VKIYSIIFILFCWLVSSVAFTQDKAKKDQDKPPRNTTVSEIIKAEEIVLESILNNQSAALEEKYRQKALKGNADSAFMLGLLYKKAGELEQCGLLRGKKGVTQPGNEAQDCVKRLTKRYSKWIRAAAKRNHPLALFEMALIYDRRNAIKYNRYKRLSKRSLYWIKKAADKGEQRAVGFLAQYQRAVED